MRHLHLSKLTQDKKKQNKLRDFTVRSWRVADVADITGIENLFSKLETAKAQQMDVEEPKCNDINIGKYVYCALKILQYLKTIQHFCICKADILMSPACCNCKCNCNF